MLGFSEADFIGWIVFGGIGMIACFWGKTKGYWQPWVLGVALGIFPYFVGQGIWLWVIGGILTALLPFARD